MYEQFHDRGVEFIGLTSESEDSLSEVKQFLDDTGITWPNGYGARETLAGFEVTAIPAVWVIGPDGKVVWNKASSGTLEDGIRRALQRLEET